ncbi:TetR/AcrR family transcriptional regulator [Mycobacterium sp. ITM-2016-00318]|uniref:TetR/AcrR family transcriptional regulator n=1 Tax=Mycobacterium sp. ITM-2016-00318 TaxID=2099693 RepID=UPI0021065637|nr:TetR/AcrR family transcriptional regulator [Mycobacterium sp. ITM-2016-00318]WNG91570.1 TetR/AcrR family transcriptional regulator [Mycobacterium sp. ITM-2016-00318]
MTVLPDAQRVRPGTSPAERIRNAAMKSFATHGFTNTSLRAVASAAGVSLGLVQHHFATKEGLIKAVDDYVLTVVITQITQEIPASTSDSVAEIGDRVTRMISELPDIVDYVGRALIDGRPVGYTIFDALLNSGTARWNQRGERGETRPDLDLTWAAVNSLVLALGTFILRGHIERNLPEPLTSPAQLQRWHASVTMLLREGLFRRPE